MDEFLEGLELLGQRSLSKNHEINEDPFLNDHLSPLPINIVSPTLQRSQRQPPIFADSSSVPNPYPPLSEDDQEFLELVLMRIESNALTYSHFLVEILAMHACVPFTALLPLVADLLSSQTDGISPWRRMLVFAQRLDEGIGEDGVLQGSEMTTSVTLDKDTMHVNLQDISQINNNSTMHSYILSSIHKALLASKAASITNEGKVALYEFDLSLFTGNPADTFAQFTLPTLSPLVAKHGIVPMVDFPPALDFHFELCPHNIIHGKERERSAFR